MKTSALGLGLAAVVASAATADITGVVQVGSSQTVADFGGATVTVYTVDLYAVADNSSDTLLNVYNMTLGSGAPSSFYQSTTGAGWTPTNLGGPFDNEATRKGDSFVTIGGFGTNAEQENGAGEGTGLDPNFGGNSAAAPGALAGWFNSNPPSLNGQVGTTAVGLGVLIGRFSSTEGEFSLEGTTLSTTANQGLGTDAVQGTWTIVPAPGALALLAVAGLTGRRRRG